MTNEQRQPITFLSDIEITIERLVADAIADGMCEVDEDRLTYWVANRVPILITGQPFFGVESLAQREIARRLAVRLKR